MLDNKTGPHTRISNLLGRTRSLSLCIVVVLACAPCALAQGGAVVKEQTVEKTSGAQVVDGPVKGGDATAVRERRADGRGADASAGDEAAAKGEPAAKVERVKKPEGESTAAVVAVVDVYVDADADVVELKAKIADAKSDAERARLRRDLVERLVEQGRKSEAVAALRAMLGEERFDPAGFYNIGNALARLDEPSDAAEAYRKAVAQRRGHYSRAQHNLGVVLIRLGRWEEAQESLAAALRLEGGVYPEASYNVGRLHAMRGEAGLAIDAWTHALAHKPDHAEAAIALARALAEDGDPERGLSVLDAFSKRDARRGPEVPRSIEVARGEIVAALNLSAGSERGRAPRVDDSSATAPRPSSSSSASPFLLHPLSVDQQTYDLLRRARAARDSGRDEDAVALYRRVIERREGYFPPANLELGFSLANLRRDPEAIEALRTVASKDGARYPVAFYHLGRLYERAGEFARARESFARAAALYGDANPQLLLDLSRVSEKSGDARAAAEAMETYVRETARLGGTPSWAHERLAALRRKVAPAAIAPEK